MIVQGHLLSILVQFKLHTMENYLTIYLVECCVLYSAVYFFFAFFSKSCGGFH